MEKQVEYKVEEQPEDELAEAVDEAIEAITEERIRPEDVNLSNLAATMLLWEQRRRELDRLENQIKDAVLILGATQTVGYVRATYNNPRKSYDYETPAKEFLSTLEFPGLLVKEHTPEPVTDWRGLCKAENVEPIVTEGKGPGSVSVKLLKK